MIDHFTGFDAEELIHLAINASAQGNRDKAIAFLKASLAQAESGTAQYLLAAEHAELGMYQRAAQEMEQAIALDPELHAACIQLGQLYILLNQPEQAKLSWQKIATLPDNHYLGEFARGLIALISNDEAKAQEYLESGINLNQDNQPLNNDMQKVLSKLTQESREINHQASEADSLFQVSNLGSTHDNANPDQQKQATHQDKGQHLFMSLYESDQEH